MPFEKEEKDHYMKINNREYDDYMQEAIRYIDNNIKGYGNKKIHLKIPFHFEDCKKWIKHFISNKLHNFGRY